MKADREMKAWKEQQEQVEGFGIPSSTINSGVGQHMVLQPQILPRTPAVSGGMQAEIQRDLAMKEQMDAKLLEAEEDDRYASHPF